MITSASSYDSIRTSRMAGYGLLLLGPSQHLWFNLLSKALPKRDMLTTFKKMFMGQAVFGPLVTTVFFSYNAALQGERSPLHPHPPQLFFFFNVIDILLQCWDVLLFCISISLLGRDLLWSLCRSEGDILKVSNHHYFRNSL